VSSPPPTNLPLPATPTIQAKSDLVPEPVTRNLRIFAFDPSVSARVDTAGISEITIGVRWEKNLQPGPIGEYLEVVDTDPASGMFYKPVDLRDPRVLAQNGLAPSESNPQFHQQMVYAVAMATIEHFEQALGRVALWSSHRPSGVDEKFVGRPEAIQTLTSRSECRWGDSPHPMISHGQLHFWRIAEQRRGTTLIRLK